MLTTTRRGILLDRLDRDGQLAVAPLAAEFGLSEDTLRRDLRELAAEGRLIRVHGGAVPASPTHQPVQDRRESHAAEKLRLVKAAAGLIEDGQIVIVDGGTTHAGLAAAIPRDRRLTVVTHSPAIAASFEFHPGVELRLIGGRIFRHSMVALGPEAAESYGRLKADLCLLGITGIHPQLGLTTGDGDEAALKRIMVAAAAETVTLATSDKINRASAWQIVPEAQLSILISCAPRPDWLAGTIGHHYA